MKKEKLISLSVGALLIFCFIAAYLFLLPKVKEEWNEKNDDSKMTIKEIINMEGHFFVYFYKENCRYCDNIKDDIQEFAKNNTVYYVDVESCDNLENYDWDNHAELYDVEIGEKQDKLYFYDNLSEDEIMKKYQPLLYKIVLVNEDNQKKYPNKQLGKIYAVATHPRLTNADFSEDGFMMTGVPILVEFNEHNLQNYYFDDKEIVEFMGSDTVPLDDYWNLE